MTLEMADRDVLVPIITLADDAATVQRLVTSLTASIERHRGAPRRIAPSPAWSVRAETAISPRDAFFAPHETVKADAAIGRVCAELIAPYPPGVPVLAPGEVVTVDALEALRATRADGGRIAYAADPTLATLQVV
jgi:lysine decarboxylase